MNLIDSSVWLEYFTDGPNAKYYKEVLSKADEIVVPTICIYEVFKVVLREGNENDALQAIALMQQGQLVDLTSDIALQASKISIEKKLPMADSIILSTAQYTNAVIWTQDRDFQNIPNVKYFPKK